jgi:signal transduction histidine kinase
MELKRRNLFVYGLLLAVWTLVVAWQVEEHQKVKESAKTDLRKSSRAIANTVGAFIRGLEFRGAVFPDRLEPVLNELVNGATNEVVKSSELVSIALLNASGDRLATAGKPIDLGQTDIVQEGERWGQRTVTMVYPVEGARVTPEGTTNTSTVVLPPFRDLTNNPPESFRRGFRRDRPEGAGPGSEPKPDGPPPERRPEGPPPEPRSEDSNSTNASGVDRENRPRESFRPRRPFWARGMEDKDYQALIQKRELHGLVLAMSTDTFQAICLHDLWLRCIIAFFSGISAAGVALAWRNVAKSSELQLRLVRASEMNTHLKEMNLAAAGLAHETRNPLNIIRGMAQMISKQPSEPDEIRTKSRAIVDETDKVTAQLNEFINYSRPREVRRTVLSLNAVVNEVVRALGYDLEEKKIQLEIKGEPFSIEADDQLLRQVLFNLVLNAIQALDEKGRIEIVMQRSSAAEASLEVRDNGPGVPPERRSEIFKPYFTTQQKGTGLGLAIVQQNVLAHGWEIACLSNQPTGAVFRITHLKLAAKV